MGNALCVSSNLFRYLGVGEENIPTYFNSYFDTDLDLEKYYKENTESSHKLHSQSLPLKYPH